MEIAALCSVVSVAVVAASLSSAAVQLQPTSVVVSRPAAVAAPVSVVPEQPAAAPATETGPAPARRRVAAPARPAHVDLPAGTTAVSLRPREAGPRPAAVDVLACTEVWTETGECLGEQTEVLRDAVLDTVQDAVRLPPGAHVRVSTRGGGVEVEPAAVPPARVP